MSSRDRILGRVRAALADVADEAEVPVVRGYGHAPPDDLVSLFVARLVDYKASVRQTEDLVGVVKDLLRGRRVATPAGVPAEWIASVDAVRDEPPLSARDLDGLDGVITGCAVAIAETGTIVLDAGPDQGRRLLTLVPDYHLCVVRRDQIVAGVPEAIARLDPTRPLTWISGPSATSDIEFNRVEGVHGPRTLEVLVV